MIWLIGYKGMLGTEVEKLLLRSEMLYFKSDIDVDITELENLKKFSKDTDIDCIINCSAYTAVDKAEDEPEKAKLINSYGVKNIAYIAEEKGAILIHISTDYVFSGKQKKPYEEDDAIDPQSVYGYTKAEGEENVQKMCSRYFIIRTSWLYGKNGKNFVYTMLNLFKNKDEINVVCDQWDSPTYAVDLAKAIIQIIVKNNDQYGIYHYSNEGETSWHLFSKEIYNIAIETGLINTKCKVNKITTEEFPTIAKRPQYSLLSKAKIKKTFDLEVPDWKESIRVFLKEIRNAKTE